MPICGGALKLHPTAGGEGIRFRFKKKLKTNTPSQPLPYGDATRPHFEKQKWRRSQSRDEHKDMQQVDGGRLLHFASLHLQ